MIFKAWLAGWRIVWVGSGFFILLIFYFPIFSKLPQGNPLTVVLLGKTGSGKSATANSIIGRECFVDSPSGGSVTQYCRIEKRTEERVIGVIDTPGIMDTAPVSAMDKLKGKADEVTLIFNQKQDEVLTELYNTFVMSPDGIDAVILTIKYGCRFGMEDAEALKRLQNFFGKEANDHMVVIFTHGDQAVRDAKKKKRSIEDHLKWYIGTLPDWVQAFLKEIGDRRLLFNNALDVDENPNDCKKQVSELIQVRTNYSCDFPAYALCEAPIEDANISFTFPSLCSTARIKTLRECLLYHVLLID